MIKGMARLGTVGAVATLGLVMVAGPAGADTPEVFAASASAQALQLSAFGQSVTAGISDVNGGSSLAVKAHALGELTVLASTAENSASVSGDNQSKATPETCGTPKLDLPLPVTLGVACSSTSASVAGGLPNALATGKVADLSLGQANLNLPSLPVLSTLNQTIQPILQPVDSALGIDVVKTLNVNPSDTPLASVLQTLGLDQIVSAKLGESVSSLSTTASAVTSKATASGGEIDILGLTALNNKPLAQIIVGSSAATATYNRATGVATPAFDPSLVTVILNQATGSQTIKLAPGQSQTILAGTPLESTITVAGGSTAKNADGSVTATASAVALDLLKGINNGLSLHLADAKASIGGNLPTITPASPAVPAKALPFTGSTPTLPLAGAGLLGVALIGRRVWRIFR